MKEVSYQGYTIYIGENAEENQHLVLNSNANDYWAHISGYPSAHAVISNPSGSRVHNKIIKRACCLIKSGSTKCKSISKLQFDVCRISNLNTTSTPGLVELKEAPKKITI